MKSRIYSKTHNKIISLHTKFRQHIHIICQSLCIYTEVYKQDDLTVLGFSRFLFVALIISKSKLFSTVRPIFVQLESHSIQMKCGSEIISILFLVVSFSDALHTTKPCRLQEVEHGKVCVNEERYCDTLDTPPPRSEEYILVTSSSWGDRFTYERGNLCEQYIRSKFSTPDADTVVTINAKVTHQTVQGFGGAWTGAVTTLVNKLPESLKKCFYESYFAPNVGMRYSLIRLPIGSSDFDEEPYVYNLNPMDDPILSNFTLNKWDIARNEQLKDLVRMSNNTRIKFMGSVWSAPPWMKQNYVLFAFLNNQIKPRYYQTFADYHLKWLRSMHDDGIDVFSISTGNEPYFSLLDSFFYGTGWTAKDQAIWISKFLGPTIKNSEFTNVEMHGYDDNRSSILGWLQEMMNTDPNAFNYLSAIDAHSYNDLSSSPEILDEVRRRFPDKPIWITEMSFNAGKGFGPLLGSWRRAEELIYILMSNLNHSTVAHLDWNFLLDHQGGPTFTRNYLDAPIIINSDNTEMYKQPLFYVMAHFSRFIPPGSVRIDVKVTGTYSSVVFAIGFLQPDRTISVFLYNNDPERIIDVTVKDDMQVTLNIRLKPKSLNTLIYAVANPFEYPFPNCLLYMNPFQANGIRLSSRQPVLSPFD